LNTFLHSLWKKKILTVWKRKFWQFENENFDSLKRKILTVWKRKFWQFENQNFDSLKRKILTVWKAKFWKFLRPKNFFWQHNSLGITGRSFSFHKIPQNKLGPLFQLPKNFNNNSTRKTFLTNFFPFPKKNLLILDE
jgi:hypothetical protein